MSQPDSATRQARIDLLIADINELAGYIAAAKQTVENLQAKQDILLKEWFAMETELAKPAHRFDKRKRGDVVQLARESFEQKKKRGLLKVAGGDEKVADIIGTLIYGSDNAN